MEDKLQEKRFDDFKNEMFRAISDLKETLGNRISELSGEVKAYMHVSQRQDRELVELKTRNKNNEDDIGELRNELRNDLRPKVEKVAEDTTKLKTELETTQHNFKTALTIVGLGLSLLTLILRFWKG